MDRAVKMRRFLAFGALALLLGCVMTACAASGSGEAGAYMAQVVAEGQVVAQLPLDADARETVATDLGSNTIVVQDGAVRIEEADCPNGDCMRQGSLSAPGGMLVCLPHKLYVEVVAANEAEAADGMRIDTVAQ